MRSLLLAMQGDVEGARSSARQAWELIEEFELTLSKGIFAVDVGYAEALAGDLEGAVQVLRRGHDVLVDVGETGVLSTLAALFAHVLLRLGRVDEAESLALRSRDIAAVDDLDAQPRWRAALACVRSRRGEHAGAEELAREAVELVEPLDFLPLQAVVHDALGEVLAAGGQVGEATAAVEQAAALHERKGDVVSAARSRAVLDDLRSARPS